MLPWAHPSSNSKRHLDRFILFCIAHSTASLYFTMGSPSPQNCLFLWGNLDPRLIHDSYGPSKPKTQTAARLLQPFLHSWLQSVSILFKGLPHPPSKLPVPIGESGPHLTHRSSTQTASQLVWQFLQGSLLWQTDRQSDRPQYWVCNNRHVVRWCSLKTHKILNLNKCTKTT